MCAAFDFTAIDEEAQERAQERLEMFREDMQAHGFWPQAGELARVAELTGLQEHDIRLDLIGTVVDMPGEYVLSLWYIAGALLIGAPVEEDEPGAALEA